ncbi:Mediator complex, subunit Med4 [Phaffia rhodozyma]|uniref:Mediator of RNA polymerase II transcription subunit 4 n=1 Tax=Phaffia rhodozyma TaxID=264483 RepID=A0A0F7SGK0_PHARH|nr:Mediator complex, subunit Med4 [Phaffia rhodozyma]
MEAAASHLSVPTQASRHLPPLHTIHSELAALDGSLATLCERARIHQEKWSRLERLKKEVERLEVGNRKVLIEMESGRRELRELVEEGKEVVRSIDTAFTHKQDPPTVLAYASSLAPYTSAPPSFDPSLPPSGIFRPPFPPESTLRRGKLGLGEGLGVVGVTSEVPDGQTLQSGLPSHLMNGISTNRPQMNDEIFDFDLNSDLDD